VDKIPLDPPFSKGDVTQEKSSFGLFIAKARRAQRGRKRIFKNTFFLCTPYRCGATLSEFFSTKYANEQIDE
jgi:hypothetical protein